MVEEFQAKHRVLKSKEKATLFNMKACTDQYCADVVQIRKNDNETLFACAFQLVY